MEKMKIYLETSVFSFYHETREYGEYPIFKAQVRGIFERIKAGEYEPFTSIFVMDEITKEKDIEKLEKMRSLISYYDITFLEVTDEVVRIAALYIQEEAISPAWETDALHIAMATVHGLDLIVSLNFTHIVRVWTIDRVRRVNKREGYQGIGIYKPSEVLEL
jgi:predicted nucleic acid-binding protein